ncbi:hypothetical protein [Tahibacter soli]|uniref:Uncharacterized protein n=1 Tax=Tahibacter soli TaxID=2983605 RepID=A0A9X4BG18_9GAMM|nr:hypothetical protein [Tahibacter soli]MDC8012075.1 hypothetical protein [Tahibacter soli]
MAKARGVDRLRTILLAGPAERQGAIRRLRRRCNSNLREAKARGIGSDEACCSRPGLALCPPCRRLRTCTTMIEYLFERIVRTALERSSMQTVVLVLFALFALIAAIVPVMLLLGFFAH